MIMLNMISNALCQIEKNVMKKNDSDSDSSSLPSLEEETKSKPKNTKEQKQKKEKKTKTDDKNRGPKVRLLLTEWVSAGSFLLLRLYDE